MVRRKNSPSVYILLSAAGLLLVACSPKVKKATTDAGKAPVVRGPHFITDSIYTQW